jgi:uncharacterized protein
MMSPTMPTPPTLAHRIALLDWAGITADLDARGVATTGALLTPGECASLAALYPEDAAFRSHIIMARHGFGKGESSTLPGRSLS